MTNKYLTMTTKWRTKMVTVQKGAVKFKSIRAAAESLSVKTGEPVNRVYMRTYMRLRFGQSASKAFHTKPRKYQKKVA